MLCGVSIGHWFLVLLVPEPICWSVLNEIGLVYPREDLGVGYTKLQIAMSPERRAVDTFLRDLRYILDRRVCFSHVLAVEV